jgi:thiamine pyrophosphate-dependent acetolactate synthase large subunit-like protein
MGKINGGHLVGKYLKEVENVDIVFGISGGHLESILDGFTEYKIRPLILRAGGGHDGACFRCISSKPAYAS